MSLRLYETTKCLLVHQRDGRTYYLSPGRRGHRVTARRRRKRASVFMHTYASTGAETPVMFKFQNGATIVTTAQQPQMRLALLNDRDEPDGSAPSPSCLFCLEPAYSNLYRLRSWQNKRYYVTIQGNVAVLRTLDDLDVNDRDQMFRIVP